MGLLIIAGLYAIIVGRITLTRHLHLVGRKARIYGVLLIVLFIPFRLFVAIIIGLIVPKSELTNIYINHGLSLALSIIFVLLLTLPFREK